MSEHGAAPKRGFEPLAIIGMGCLFPKADSLEAYWTNIREAVDCVGPVPASHWQPNDYFDADPKRPDFTYAQRGAFLEPVDFDPLAYGILPNAIEATDTSQLLGMVAAGMALRNAGYGPDREYDRSRVSAIVGVTGALELVIPLGARLGHPKWRRALRDAGLDEAKTEEIVQRIADEYVPWQEASFPGLLGNVVAGRISKQFDLGGTNCVVDAACASSLSAVHLAALELHSGKADMVVTGGVDTFNDIFMYMCFSKTPALSATGDSRPFAKDADGTILGEGLGMVVLKRLADAQRDGDPIDAVITGIGSSSDGKGDAIYAPNAAGQRRAMLDAYEAAGVTPDTIELIEAHGTGTKVGDATEVKSLSSVFAGAREEGPWCALGSVKSQIGHTKAAAGAAGLIKAALALRHKVLPPTAKVAQPAEALLGGDSPFYVNTEKRPWVPGNGHPRRAGVSAFGFGGSNFHAVLEEHGASKQETTWDGAVQLAAFSGDSTEDLTKQLDAFAQDSENWETVRAKAQASRGVFNMAAPHRLCLVLEKGGKPVAEAVEAARAQLAKGEDSWTLPDGSSYATGDTQGGLALLFPGQGSQYTGMLRDLACDFPEALDALAHANEAYRESGKNRRLSDAIYPLPAFDDDTRARNEEALRATDVAQPALGAVSLGACGILRRFGITADAYAGHSYGELPALSAAGVLSEADCLRLSIERGSLMAGSGEDRGTMLAVRAPLADIEELISSHELDVVLANRNAPDQAVLSGSREAIAAAQEVLASRKIAAKELPVAAAFHSALVADASKPFGEALSAAAWSAPRAPVYANTTGRPYPANEAEARGLLAGQLAQPVHFSDTIEHLYENGARTFVEVGPKAVLTGLVSRILAGKPHAAAAIDASQGKRNGVVDLARVLALVAASGHGIDLAKWDDAFEAPAEGGRKRMTLPVGGANIHEPKRREPSPKVEPKATPKAVEQPAVPAASVPKPLPKPVIAPERTAPAMREETPPPSAPTAPVGNDALMILQRMQEQTAQLHKQFLDGQQTALETLKSLVQGGGVAAHPPQSPFEGGLPEASPAGRESVEARSAKSEAYPRAGAEAIASPHPTPRPEEEGVLGRASVPASRGHEVAPPHPGEGEKVLATLIAIIAEKTGYPEDMLDASMSLDADLGIDSIKRVEILSAVQEALPGAPAIESDQLGQLQTIEDVVGFLSAGAAHPPQSPFEGGLAGTQAAAGGISAAEEFLATLIAIIAEKTGYPEDMLDASMSLDADLGIDSIKRVEILSAVQEALPGAPAIESDQLGQLQTIEDVVGFLSAGAAHPPQSPFEGGLAGTQAAAGGISAAEEVLATLIAIIAEKTGYPEDMLDASMSLDADLGIDSIKRVEILSAVQEALPGAPAIESDQLGQLQTIEDVVDFLATSPGGDPRLAGTLALPAGADSPPFEKGGPGGISALECLAVTVQAIDDAASKPVPLTRERTIWLTGDDSGLSDALAWEFQKRGYKAEAVAWSARDGIQPGETGGLVLVAPVSGDGGAFTQDAFALMQRLSPALQHLAKNGGAVMASLTRLDGAFGLLDGCRDDAAAFAGLAGLVKTAGHEWDGVHCRALDAAAEVIASGEALSRIVDGLLSEGPAEIGLRPEGRVTPSLQPIETESGAPAFGADDVVVISGGGRGVTAAVAIELARRSQAALVLLGRSPMPEAEPAWLEGLTDEAAIKKAIVSQGLAKTPKEIEQHFRSIEANRELRHTLSAIEAAGAKCLYRSADIRDRGSVARAIAEARDALGPITGVVHGAGVLADKRIEDKSADDFDRVFGTKVDGLDALLEATASDPVKAIALFSSSTGRFGRTGQIDYAAANEVLNKRAQAAAKTRNGCRVVAFNWGPWDGGMVTPGLKALFEQEGVGTIGLAEGAAYCCDEIAKAQGPVEIVVFGAGTGSDAAPREAAETPEPARPALEIVQAGDPSLEKAFGFEASIGAIPILRDHVLDHKGVVPAALQMEWLGHAALHSHPGMHLAGLDDFRVLKGITLEAAESRALSLWTGPATGDNGRLMVPVELRGILPDGAERLHARATALVAGSHDAPLPYEPLERVAGYPCPREAYYEDARLFHGHGLQCVVEVEGCADDAIVGVVQRAPLPKQWMTHPLRGSWLMDPMALDGAFQLMILWSRQGHGAPCLPVTVGRYRQFRKAFPKSDIRITARVVDQSSNRATATIDFTNWGGGDLVARIEGFECVIDASLDEAFARNTLGGAAAETAS